jgi:hypothetical protein
MRQKLIITFVWIIILGLIGWGALVLLVDKPKEAAVEKTKEEEKAQSVETQRKLGVSVEGRPVESYTFGAGDRHLLFVGGIHGGYEWNSVLLAYEMIDHFVENPNLIPEETRVSIIPSLNPDGVFNVVGKEGRFLATDIPPSADISLGRFNANDVDLNRNFDCKWQPESTWRGSVVSAGTEAFSEPEAKILRDYVISENPDAVVFWHSKANAVYASECTNGILPETMEVMNTYATASGYRSVDTFDAYPITGDAEGWLASIGIPAITVELETRNSIEWDKNLSGTLAILQTKLTSQKPSTLEPEEVQAQEENTEDNPEEIPIAIEECHIPFEIGTYGSEVTLSNAENLTLPFLKERNSSITEQDLEAKIILDELRVYISRDLFESDDDYCVTWEERPMCLGQWVEVKNGRALLEAQNPC